MHVPLLAIAEISRPKLVSVAVQAGWSLNWSQIPKTGFLLMSLIYEPLHDKTNKMTCTPNKDSDQPGYPPSLISLAVRSKGSQGPQAFFMRTAKTLIRLRNDINTLASYDRHNWAILIRDPVDVTTLLLDQTGRIPRSLGACQCFRGFRVDWRG